MSKFVLFSDVAIALLLYVCLIDGLSLLARHRQASAGRLVMLLLLLLTFLFFNDRLEQRDLRNYKIDLHQIFRDGRHVDVDHVDVLSGIGFAIGQGTLPWQPILAAKSATRLLSWDSHSTTDGSREKRTGR